MNVDIPRLIGAVSRTIHNGERNGRPTRILTARRIYDTDIEDAWDALTNPERIPRWFLPVSGELRVGGHYQLKGNAGGEITRCDRPNHLSLTWGMHGDVSWVDVRLSPDGASRTRLELVHEAHVPEELWGQYGPGGVGIGWDMALFGLDEHLRTRATVDPKEVEVWSASNEGKDMMKRSGDEWCAASIAAGTDAAGATAAAARVLAFYTGEGGEAAHHGGEGGSPGS